MLCTLGFLTDMMDTNDSSFILDEDLSEPSDAPGNFDDFLASERKTQLQVINHEITSIYFFLPRSDTFLVMIGGWFLPR